MKKLMLLLTLLLAAGVALAQETSSAQQPSSATGSENKPYDNKMAAGTKQLAVQVVAADPVAKTITVKKESDPGRMDQPTAVKETTLPVEGQALVTLKTITPGEKVKLTCRTTAGKETAVLTIEKGDKSGTQPPDKN